MTWRIADPRRVGRRMFLLLVGWVAMTAVAEAKIFKWKDDQGRMHFTDSVEKVPEQYRDSVPSPGSRKTRPDPDELPHPIEMPEAVDMPEPEVLPPELMTPGSPVTPFMEEQEVTRVRVAIVRDRFVPVQRGVAYRWNPNCARTLEDAVPAKITQTPRFMGERQKYGYLKLGTGADRHYYFALDLPEGKPPALYFDANRNNDLTDDPGPVTGSGPGLFSGLLEIPFHRLVGEAPIEENFRIWLFTNPKLWETFRLAHYSKTQLQGTIAFGGKRYSAILADSGCNDADFTNDGIYIDINADGEMDRDAEYFPPGEGVRIDDREYEFNVVW